jgi:AcrR family transcriptional regulator
MARRSRFSEEAILDATATIVAGRGPSAATIGAIGTLLDAPSGSIYHRFPSRDVLLGRLWLNKTALFQSRFAEAITRPDPYAAGLSAALSFPALVRDDFTGARIMLLYRREEFLSESWPPEMHDEARRLKRQLSGLLSGATRRLFGEKTLEKFYLTIFATIDIPIAAVRYHVGANKLPPPYVDSLITTAYSALIHSQRAGPSR